MTQPACKPAGAMRLQRIGILLLILISVLPVPTLVSGSPSSRSTGAAERHVLPDWMSPEVAAQLDLGFDVRAPAHVPDPFSDAPAVTTYDGYYSLYWMLSGASPTFLQISGEAGGEIPDYSKYDRNNQLEQNAEVDGAPAYHDLTPIYDLVYWQVDGIVYSVESRNLSSDDSLSLANALVSLSSSSGDDGTSNDGPSNSSAASLNVPRTVNAGDQISVTFEGPDGSTLTADEGYFTESGEGIVIEASANGVAWQAPSPSEDTSVFFVLSDPETGEWIATANILVVARAVAAQQSEALAIYCPSSISGGSAMSFTLSGRGVAIIDAGEGYFPAGPPNTDFDPDSDDDATMVGTGPGSGTVELVWVAPTVDSPRTVYLFASNEAGETPGECAIEVRVAQSSDNPSSADAEVGASGSESNVEAAEVAEEAQPTATQTPTKPTRTPAPYDEVRGLPTAVQGNAGTEDSGGGTSTMTPTVTATVRQNATFAPTISEEGMVASIIGPDGGTLVCPDGAEIEIPAGALKEPSTVTIIPVANSKLPVQRAVELIPNTGFDVTIAGPDGRAIDYSLLEHATFRVRIDDEETRTGMKLYRVEGTALVPLSNTRIEGDTLSVSIDGFSRFVAGVPSQATAGTNRNLLPFVLAAVVVLFAMIAMVVLGGIFRPRRHRIITNRRTARTRYR